jgi:hypothetical protein
VKEVKKNLGEVQQSSSVNYIHGRLTSVSDVIKK